MLCMMPERINLSSYVLNQQGLIGIFSYNELLVTNHCKAPITRCFHIFTNPLNCFGYGNVLLAYTTCTTLSSEVVSNSNRMSNGFGFWGKSIKCPQTSLNIPKLKLLLELNFKIIRIRCAFAITTSSTDIRSSKKAG